jgi:hypothetical protein
MLEHSQVHPLPTLLYSFSDAMSALRQFTRAQHVGKILTRIPHTVGKGASEEDSSAGSWVISGGLGSLGMLTAEWLAVQGQLHIMLLGRIGR